VEKTLNEFRGEVNERTIRNRVEAEYGRSFARKFVAQGLRGLARLAVPKKDTYKTCEIEKVVQHYSKETDVDKQDQSANKLLKSLEVNVVYL
jgi:hypothetical protein